MLDLLSGCKNIISKTIYLFILPFGILSTSALHAQWTKDPKNKTATSSHTKVTLVDAKKYAIAHNFNVKSFEEKINATTALRNIARSNYLPKFGVAGGTEHQSSGDTSETGSQAYVFGSINLFNGFRDSYSSRKATITEERQKIQIEKEKFLVGLSVEEVFHEYLYYKDLIEINQEALRFNKKHQKFVASMVNVGEASQADIKEFDLNESILASELISLKHQLESSRINLRKFLGEDIGSKIEPVGRLQHQHVVGKLMEYIEKIQKVGYDLRLALKDHDQAVLDIKMVRSQWLPSLDFEVKAGLLPLDERPESGVANETAVNFQLIATLDLFSGMKSYWEKQYLTHLEKSKSWEVKSSILTSVTTLEKSFRKLKAIQKSVDLELGNAKKVKDYYDSILKEYRRGYRNSSDLKSAAEWYFNTKAKQLKYKYDFLLEKVSFEKHLGSELRTEIISEDNI